MPSQQDIWRSNQKIRQVELRLLQIAIKSRIGYTPNRIPEITPSQTLPTSGYIPQPDVTSCGPTAAHNLLLSWGRDISLTQLQIELDYQSIAGTPFGSQWPMVLNRHSLSNYYVITWAPDQSTLWNAFVGDTLDSRPFILDVHMNLANGYLNGYSNMEYWHYVVGNGYMGYYNVSKYGTYFDQYNGRAGTYGQHALALSRWIPLLRERGIIW